MRNDLSHCRSPIPFDAPLTRNGNGGRRRSLSTSRIRTTAPTTTARRLDRTHIAWSTSSTSFRSSRSSQNRLLKSTLGGWELSGIVTMETGLPLNITLGGSQGSNGLPNATNRPDLIGSISYPQTVTHGSTPAAFSSPALGAWGNLAKGALRGPGRDNWNISLFKSFLFSETRGSRFELRVETFNTFNHTQFNNVSTSFSSSNFGQVTSTWDPRVFQLGAKICFRLIRIVTWRAADLHQWLFVFFSMKLLHCSKLLLRLLGPSHFAISRAKPVVCVKGIGSIRDRLPEFLHRKIVTLLVSA